ncbi:MULTISPECIES: zinc-dependent metalloprotease [Flavobacterium]|uniref:Reprolysin-like metallopeptidase n=1 Tax=Flavobacterium jumunjinense TaxID=998845 RepID=A0ABV5GPM6_9FLAO|nr:MULTISPECIES: zinc-dependent metalloprotease [Flavobacterium]
MKTQKLLSLFLILVINTIYGQRASWEKISEEQLKTFPKMERANMPSKFELFTINLDRLKLDLANAPVDIISSESNVVISFPNSNGELENYKVFEAPIMEEALAARYSNIKSYIGKGVDRPSNTVRFSITVFGLHAMIFSADEAVSYIDTYTKDKNNYIVYNKRNISQSRHFQCLVNDELGLNKADLISGSNAQKASDGRFRTFRLAMACTIEYAAFHVNAAGLGAGTLAQKKGAVLSAMTVTMTRVNGIYERDMSLRMVLIANQDPLIFIDNDNFSNNDANALIDESQAQITAIAGAANFDIGHTVSTGGGGLAGPAPCYGPSKASGITGSGAPVGDPYDVDYVAHEMGHQFGANHTFNNSCGNNRNNSTAVEPGSGSTIMAYAGICGPNVQSNSDAHFHAVSIAEMVDMINTYSTCANTVLSGNTPPVVNAGGNYTIPRATAFVLKGSASDVNGDALTYCWEQTDTQISTQPPVQSAASGPNYRSRIPSVSPDRYMPPLANVVAGNLVPTWEVTPSVARTMNFALTVRDNRSPLGGQTSRGDMVVTVSGVAGPFVVTSQNTTGISYTGLSNQMFTWNVAGTTANNVNTANVKISLSTDNGVTFPTVLSASTPNDGSESLTIPNGINSTNCRIKIEAVNNLFYSVNSTKFSISSSLSSDSFEFEGFKLYPNPNKGSFNIELFTSSNRISVNVHDISGRLVYDESFSNLGTFSQNIELGKVQSGVYLVSISDGDNKTTKRVVVE